MELYLPIILDGAMGTRLQAAGYSGQKQQELWMLENPDIVENIERSYIEAGSRIIYAPTFQSNPIKLEEDGFASSVAEFNRGLAQLSRNAVAAANAEHPVYIAGDISPTGHFLAPLGDKTWDYIYSCYEEQVLALDEYVDLWAVETMMTLSDARAAILAIRAHSSKPILASFSCDAAGRTVSGGDVCSILAVLQGMEIDAFGLNCSNGPDEMLTQLERLSGISELPLIAKPNAGMPKFRDGAAVYDLSPEDFVRNIPRMAELGVGLFGGCCGTSEEHISALSKALYDGGGTPIDIARPIAFCERFPGKLPLADERHLFMPDVDFDINENSILIDVDSDAAIDIIVEEQYSWDKPLCLTGDDITLIEKALCVYQGRAMYSGNLGEDKLAPLVRRYGLVL